MHELSCLCNTLIISTKFPRISRGLIFAILTGKHEKRALNFAIKAFPTSFSFFKKYESLTKINELEQAMCETVFVNYWHFTNGR